MADKKLATVRTKFIEKVSKEVINQLLDNLLEDNILNDGEKDSIIEEHSSKADKARCLIDTVKKKGDAASRKMIAHLQSKDITLYNELGLSSDQPLSQTHPVTEKTYPVTEKTYPVTEKSIRSRVALLITNIKFTNEKLNRAGAERDEQNMEKLLTELGYEVVKYTNLTGKEIDAALIKFSKHPKLEQTDSVFVVIMSHGKLGTVLGVNFKDEEPDEFPIDNIFKHLGTEKCPALLNKPKIIIIQACRGGKDGAVFVSDSAEEAVVCDDVSCPGPSLSADEEDIQGDTLRCEHKEKDFIAFLSSTPDTVSYRKPKEGSFLIQFIVEVFHHCSREDGIIDLFTKVMQRFEKFPSHTKRQMATIDRCTLTKRFYPFPGH